MYLLPVLILCTYIYVHIYFFGLIVLFCWDLTSVLIPQKRLDLIGAESVPLLSDWWNTNATPAQMLSIGPGIVPMAGVNREKNYFAILPAWVIKAVQEAGEPSRVTADTTYLNPPLDALTFSIDFTLDGVCFAQPMAGKLFFFPSLCSLRLDLKVSSVSGGGGPCGSSLIFRLVLVF